jgi:citrate lyase subunit beta/citryl-CoA lyase
MTHEDSVTPLGRMGGRPWRLRRSCLAVPGSNPRMLQKAAGLPADQVFLDLEDSVAPAAKEAARGHVVTALREHDWGDKTVVVRVNDCTTAWTYRDIIEVVGEAGDRLDCIMLPKAQNVGQVAFVDRLISQLELEHGWPLGRIGLEVQVEDAQGLVNLRAIAAESDRLEAIIFGPGDMAAALRMPSLSIGEVRDDYPGDHWHWVLMTILVHARAAGVQAIDGPYVRIDDADGYREVATRSRALGFDGKWVLHPAQIELANEIYSVSQADFERAVDIVEALDDAAAGQGRGALMFGAEMIDEASRKLALVTAEGGRRAGMVPRATPAETPFHERSAWRAAHAGDDGP